MNTETLLEVDSGADNSPSIEENITISLFRRNL
jgi:hypothetical protein